MKVVHIVGSLEARYGGPSRSVRKLAAATAALGHDVEVLTSAPNAAAVENTRGLTVRTWKRGWPGAFCRVPEMAAHLARTRCDVVHQHGLWLRTLHYAHVKARRDRIPLVISPRGMMSPWAWRHHRTQKALAGRWLHPRALVDTAGWQVTSAEEAAEVRALGFSQPSCVAPNGVDQPVSSEVEHARAFWAGSVASDGRRVALFYSRLHEKKRVLELIDLWTQRAPIGWRLLIVGVPEQYTIEQLRGHVAHSGRTGSIDVHDGTDAPAPYPLASLFLLPSHSENFGLVIAEAMAHGVPAVVTDATPWNALNANGLGWCVPWEKFGDTIAEAAAETSDVLAARGAHAREWVLREFSWERSARELIAFYQMLNTPSA